MDRMWLSLVILLYSADSAKLSPNRYRRSDITKATPDVTKTTLDFLARVTRNKNPPPYKDKSIPIYVPSTCSSEYAAIENHTMCLDDDPRVYYYGVTEDNIKLILDKHNYIRSTVQPPATDLVKLTWDDRIAAVAQKWASQCRYGHDHYTQRYVPEIGLEIGQNAAYGYGNWDWAIQSWYNERKLWKYGVNPTSYLGRRGYLKISNFTQIVQNATYLVGCGYTMCGSTEFHVCNYASRNLNFGTPYTSGKRCSQCPLSCVDGLCDCKSLLCYNGGTLDLNKCQCQCNESYIGQNCEMYYNRTALDSLDNAILDNDPKPHSNTSIPEVTCTDEYAAIENHTMCLEDNPIVVHYGVTDAIKEIIVEKHNYLRSIVQPPATDLVKLTWDDRIAAVAQKWANQCRYGHEYHKLRRVPQIGIVIGQNAAYGYGNWDWAIQGWYNEIELWKYGVNPSSYLGLKGYLKIGHFTQIVHNATFLVGCGYSMCGSTEYHVCNYATWNLNFGTPYTSGKRCSQCPLSCVNGLCDCKGVVCYHGGTLDKNTCQCRCNPLYLGQYCETLNCPTEDQWYCGSKVPKSFCKKYGNVAEKCPYMCDKC